MIRKLVLESLSKEVQNLVDRWMKKNEHKYKDLLNDLTEIDNLYTDLIQYLNSVAVNFNIDDLTLYVGRNYEVGSIDML